MKTSLVITTINKVNKNIKRFASSSKVKKWGLIIIGDKKSPKNFKLPYGDYLDIKSQLKTTFKFAKICPENTYARKNIGYLKAFENKSEIIAETDDDNFPKKNFFEEKKLVHNVREVENKKWVNIYNLFTTKNELIWPRGLPLDSVMENKIKLSRKRGFLQFLSIFYLFNILLFSLFFILPRYSLILLPITLLLSIVVLKKLSRKYFNKFL